MGLGDGSSNKARIVVIAAVFAFLAFIAAVVLGGTAFLYLTGGRTVDAVEVTTTAKVVETAAISPVKQEAPETTTTLEGGKPGILAPVKSFIKNLAGKVECGQDEECYHETARKCEKSETTYQTLMVTQKREIRGEKDGKCIIYFENIDVNREFTDEKWLGLSMTCLIDPNDTEKDILTEVENPECSGSLWNVLKAAPKK